MDQQVSKAGSLLNMLGVAAFAVCMVTGPMFLCYVSSIVLAWGLVMMNAGFARYGRSDAKAAAVCAVSFGGMYALCNSVVYFIQITAVARGGLSVEAASLLDYTKFGMMFDLDMLGYALMAVSTFFAGLTIKPTDKGDRWLRRLLLVHGIFAVICFILPVLGLFGPEMSGADWIGTAVLEFWCTWFLPIGILSYRYFAKQDTKQY